MISTLHTRSTAFVTHARVLVLLWAVVLVACSSDQSALKEKAFERGEQYFAEKRYAEATLEYRRAVQADPKFGRARFKLAESLSANNELKEAYTEYVRAADLLPGDVDVQIRAGNMLLLGRRFQEAKDRARKILEANPNSLPGLLLLGNALAGLRDLDNAVAVTRRATEVEPDRSGVYANLGALALAKGDRAAAEQAFATAVEKNPRDAGAWLAQANFYRAVGEFDNAERSLRQAVGVEPDNPRVNRAIASHYLDTNRPDHAEPFLRKVAASQEDVGSWLDLADFYINTKRFDDARSVLKTVAEREPGFEPQSRVALIEHATGRVDEAHAVINAFLKRQPNHAGALALEARLLLRENRVAEALDKARTAVQINNLLPEAHFALGLLHLARQAPEDARKSFLEVLNLDPTSSDARLELAKVHTTRGELDTAIGYAQTTVQYEPANLQARLVLARTLMVREEDRPKALEVIQGLVKNYPASPAVYSALGSFYLAGQNRPAARQQFEHALNLDGTYIEALTSLIAMDLTDRQPEQAWQRVYARLKAQPQEPELLLVAAKFAVAVGDRRSAEQYLRRTLIAAPSNLEPYTLLGQLFIAEKRLPDAIREFQEVIKRDANSVPAHTMLGLLFHSQKDLPPAVWHYQRAVDLDSGAAAAANNLAHLYAESDLQLDQALQLALAARNKLPNSAEISDTLGWVYYKKQMLPLAITAFEHSIERDAKNPVYHYHLGLAYATSGEDAKARVSLQRALSINQNFPRAEDARRVLARLVY